MSQVFYLVNDDQLCEFLIDKAEEIYKMTPYRLENGRIKQEYVPYGFKSIDRLRKLYRVKQSQGFEACTVRGRRVFPADSVVKAKPKNESKLKIEVLQSSSRKMPKFSPTHNGVSIV